MKTIDVIVSLTENDIQDFKDVVVERHLPITIKVPAEQDDTQVKITFVPAEEEVDET